MRCFSLFSQARSEKMRGNGLSLCNGRFRLDIRKNLFAERVVKLPRKVIMLPSLGVFKRCVDGVFRDMVLVMDLVVLESQNHINVLVEKTFKNIKSSHLPSTVKLEN